MRLLLDLLPVILVEPGQVRRPGRPLAAYRFIADTRDQATNERLDNLGIRIACSVATPS